MAVAREVGVGTGTVQRIAQEMGGPFDAVIAEKSSGPFGFCAPY
jgi:hypothetical protein